ALSLLVHLCSSEGTTHIHNYMQRRGVLDFLRALVLQEARRVEAEGTAAVLLRRPPGMQERQPGRSGRLLLRLVESLEELSTSPTRSSPGGLWLKEGQVTFQGMARALNALRRSLHPAATAVGSAGGNRSRALRTRGRDRGRE
ncbi:unnamed protein product, partial [Discosporangium mesarthrocarpum]